jgi:hypothetical protein
MKLEFSRNIFEKYSNIKFYGNPSFGSRVAPCEQRRTGMTKLMVTSRNFANPPRSVWHSVPHRCQCLLPTFSRITSTLSIPDQPFKICSYLSSLTYSHKFCGPAPQNYFKSQTSKAKVVSEKCLEMC